MRIWLYQKKPKQYIAAADPVIIQTHGNQLSIKTVRHSVEIVKEISKDFIEIQNQISNNIAVKLSHNGLNGYLLFEKLSSAFLIIWSYLDFISFSFC